MVWAMAQHYPNRVTAVGALNTPFFPVNPAVNPMEGNFCFSFCFLFFSHCFLFLLVVLMHLVYLFLFAPKGMKNDPGRFDYQLYFQEEGRAEAEFERDIEVPFLNSNLLFYYNIHT